MGQKIRFIGDVHGKFDHYRELIRDIPRSIQVGDMGVGFRHSHGPRMGEMRANPPHYAMIQGDHKFIRGNHDNPAVCRQHSQWIPDGHVEDGMMFVGGAASIDKKYRIENYSWWADEELSQKDLWFLIEDYIRVKPRVMVTHECPQEIADELLRRMMVGQGQAPVAAQIKLTEDIGLRTRQALQAMWNAHSPDLWVFGHWHFPFDHVLRDTHFICLPELSHRDIEI